jgi:hypothetical protein
VGEVGVKGSVAGCGCLVILFNLWAGTASTKYLVRTYAHKEIATAPAVAIGVIGGQVVVPAAVVTWLLVKSGVVTT